MDMHSGGYAKHDFDKCYIACDARRARIYFTENFSDPDDIACQCCGNNYSFDDPGDESDLLHSTGYDRDADDVYYDDQGNRYRHLGYGESIDGVAPYSYVDCNDNEVPYDRNWKMVYEGGQDLDEYLARDDVHYVDEATVDAYFADNPE
jgi:hypothetical protein